tara:strand:+ start:862 stop:1506 length:645 start_codon:yes stop_codon:yes gene_type:complete
MLIGICGLIGSGKGTVADILVRDYKFKKLSFADKLKDTVAHLFDWDRAMLEGDTKESREWREAEDSFWTKETGKSINPRLVLQLFGTDCMRKGFDENIWVSFVKKEIISNPDVNYIVPDVRFPNEIKVIKELGGQIWQVRRGTLPLWWATAINTNENWHYVEGSHHTMKAVFPDVHESEWRWADNDDKFDHIINNDSTMEDLEEKVKKIINNSF